MTLAYHKELVPFRPTRWGDLLRDEVKGKVALYNSFYMSLYTFACMKVDREGRAGSAALEINNNLDGVLKFARANRDRVKFWWPTSNDMILALVQKDCALGNMHSPEMLTALRQSRALGAVVPDPDRAFVQVAWVIPEGTKRKALAEAAINLIFSARLQREFARRGMATAVLSAAKEAAAEDKYWGQIYPSTEEQFKTLRYYPYDAYFRDWDGLSKAWDREVLRKR
jgi:spermidine/putrescine-binding protein